MSRYWQFVRLLVLLCVAWQSGLLELSAASSQSPLLSQAAVRSNCPEVKPMYNVGHPKDRGGMNSLLQTAKSTREAIFTKDLPYEAISMEISKVYNQSSLQTSPFLGLWVNHSLNALLLAGFVVFVGVSIPGLMVAMWMFWECCYEVDEEAEEDNRNLSLKAQVVAWSLSMALILSLLLLSIFLFILLVANGWVSDGVGEGRGSVETVLPELVRLRNQSVDQVSKVTRNDLYTLQRELNSTVLSRVSSNVVSLVNETFSSRIEQLYPNISKEFDVHQNILEGTLSLLDRLADLQSVSSNNSSLGTMVNAVNSCLLDVITHCSMLLDLGGSSLEELCNELSTNQQRYIPHLEGGVPGLEAELMQLKDLINDPIFSQTDSFSNFTDFLGQLSHNLTVHINMSSDAYFGEPSLLEQRLAGFNQDFGRYYSSLSFNWPHSQEQLDVYLGERYLENWDMFRSVCTVTFVLIAILFEICILVAMVMGLWHSFIIYTSGEEMVNIEGAHQAGTMMKKLAFGFAVICAVSAVFFGVFIGVVGVMDQGCGRHGNFSEVMQYVIDNNQSWGNSFPLGTAVFENSSYPLTVGKVMDGCRRKQSLFNVLHLYNRYNLNDIIDIPESEGDNYFNMMRSIVESLEVFSVFPSTNKFHLLTSTVSLPVNWSALISLTSGDLFQAEFVGFTNLQQIIDNMTSATFSLSPSNLNQSAVEVFTSLMQSTSHNISQLTSYVDHTFLPDVVSTATYLRDNQASIASAQLLEEFQDIDEDLHCFVPKKSREQLTVASTSVTSSLSNFTSSMKETLICQTGFCHSLSVKYDHFSSAVCNDVVQGMDVYWMTLIIILALSTAVVFISLILASRFIDLELEKATRNNRFHLTSAVIRQMRAIFWFLLGNVVNLWLVVVISEDDYFHEVFCRDQPPGCCPTCVWGFGILFLILFFVMGLVGRAYQCVVLHRINKFEAMKVRRYWMERKKATQFYAQQIHFAQDLLFLIITGIYINGIGTLNIPSFFSLSLSIIGIISYVVYLFLERNYILSHFQWLKKEVHKPLKFMTQGAEPPTGSGQGTGGQSATANGPRPSGRYGSSESEQSEDDSQGTTQQDAEWMYNSNHHPPSSSAIVEHIPLPVIHEGSESIDQTGTDEVETTASAPPPPPSSHPNSIIPMAGGGRLMQSHPRQIEIDDSDIELSQVQPNMNTIPLDNLNHSDFTASQIRLHRQQLHGADISSRHTEYAASTASYYSSNNSLTAASEMQQGYYSSSQAPDEHYDSSDYKDDYDSDYSHGYSQRYLNRRYLPRLSSLSGEMSVEV